MADKAIGIFLALITLAALSVVISKRTNTVAVLNSIFNGFSKALGAATRPATLR